MVEQNLQLPCRQAPHTKSLFSLNYDRHERGAILHLFQEKWTLLYIQSATLK